MAAMGNVDEVIEADVYHGAMRWGCESQLPWNGFETPPVA